MEPLHNSTFSVNSKSLQERFEAGGNGHEEEENDSALDTQKNKRRHSKGKKEKISEDNEKASVDLKAHYCLQIQHRYSPGRRNPSE